MTPDCPSCGGDQHAQPLYELPAVPVQSVRLFNSPDAARQVRTGALEIVQCTRCGLVFNSGFDPATQTWDAEYEETQSSSARFREFARDLAGQLIQRWQLRQKRVLEVGCGKGHFLGLLCELGENVGMGVDPAFDPARRQESSQSITFRQECLEPRHMAFEPDLIVCRHTLEHLARPEEILSVISAQKGVPVFIDVPDLQRILDEGAFWDLYYEHCNYFDRHSLPALLGRHGIQVEELHLAFNGQYLMCYGRTARPSDSNPAGVGELKSGRRFKQMRGRWSARLRRWRENGKTAVLWGGGSKAVAFLSGLGRESTAAIRGVIDINPVKQDRFLPGSGIPVLAPEHIARDRPDHVVIMNPVYRAEIEAALARLGVSAELTDVNRLSA